MELLTRIDLWIIVGYMAAMLWIGYWVTDGARDVEGYTVGNRSMKAFRAIFSSASVTGVAEIFFNSSSMEILIKFNSSVIDSPKLFLPDFIILKL